MYVYLRFLGLQGHNVIQVQGIPAGVQSIQLQGGGQQQIIAASPAAIQSLSLAPGGNIVTVPTSGQQVRSRRMQGMTKQ